MSDPKTSRFPMVSAIIVAVIAVVALACILLVRGGDDADRAESQPSTPAQAPGGDVSAPPSGGPGPCGLAAAKFTTPMTDRNGLRVEVPAVADGVPCAASGPIKEAPIGPTGLLARPDGLNWQYVGGAVLPFSSSDGPTAITDHVPSGFGHTPQGAVTAAMHYSLRVLMATDVTVRTRLAEAGWQMTPTIRDQALSDLAAAPLYPPNAPSGLAPIPAAVRVSNYAPDFAHVEWAYQINDKKIRNQVDMVWADGDWKTSVTKRPKDLNAEAAAAGSAEVKDLLASDGWTQWN